MKLTNNFADKIKALTPGKPFAVTTKAQRNNVQTVARNLQAASVLRYRITTTRRKAGGFWVHAVPE